MENILPFIFLGMCAMVVFAIGYFLKKENTHLFTQKYKQLTGIYGEPLKKFSFLSGHLGSHMIPYIQYRGMITVSVYIDKLIVSVCGDALCIPYEQDRIRTERKWIFNHLVIEEVAVPAEMSKFFPYRGSLPQQAPLFIMLSQKKADLILTLIRKFQQNNSH